MSGICGIHNLFLRPLDSHDLIDQMSAQLRHRGPDGQAKFERPHLALAVCLLNIVDTEPQTQPLSNETGEVTLVFDGEIYNCRELRNDLLGRGHIFGTPSDAEVLAHLYEEKGPDFVRDLNGMFSIALWDDGANRLLLARDRTGEKPLYYWLSEDTLLFGSEIKSILEYPGVGRQIDPDAVAQYFFYGYVPTPQTIFANIKKLPAAHVMVIEGRTSRLKCYWKLHDYLKTAGKWKGDRKQEQKACEDLRQKLREAAISRLAGNMPLGVFLNGDISSSIMVDAYSELSPGKVNGFSISFPGSSAEKDEYTEYAVSHFNPQHHVLTVDSRAMRDALRHLANYLDEPIADPSLISAYLLSRFARKFIKVAFSSEGSEELFGRYPTYLGTRVAEFYLKVPKVLRREVFDRMREQLLLSPALGPRQQLFLRYLTYAEEEPSVRHHTWFGMFSPEELDQLFAPQWASLHPPIASIFSPLSQTLEGIRFDEVLTEMFYLDFRMRLEDKLLVKLDRTSMACSLEMRTPFLDHRLIEFVAGVPTNLKVRGFQGMYILRKAIEKQLPRKLVHRQKQRFKTPVAGWIRNELQPMVADALSEGKVKSQGLFNAAYIERLLQEHSSGRADHWKLLWTLLCFQLWYERWAAKN